VLEPLPQAAPRRSAATLRPAMTDLRGSICELVLL
jgi:hypothetical protein